VLERGCTPPQLEGDRDRPFHASASPSSKYHHGGASPAVAKLTAPFFSRYVNIVKGNVGPGCLSMPYTFAEGGLVPSLLILLVFAPACIYCMNLLVFSKHRLLASHAAAGVSPAKLNFEEVRGLRANCRHVPTQLPHPNHSSLPALEVRG
jgi:hypothetical protein